MPLLGGKYPESGTRVVAVFARLDKLRVIHLLEADLNLALGIIWSRRLMTQSEKVGAFGDEQWGSRKGRSANTVVLLKHFTYEHQTGG